MKRYIALLLALVCVLGLSGCSRKLIEGSEKSYHGTVTDLGMSVVNEGDRQGRSYIIISSADHKETCFWLGKNCETTAKIGDNVIVESAIEEQTNLLVATSITVVQTADKWETTVSYANWSDTPSIFRGALNGDKQISGAKHFPIFKVDTKQDLEQFKSNYGSILSMNHGYDEVPSFEDATAKYDGTFFENNSLLIVYVDANSGSYRFDVGSVYCDAEAVCVHVKLTNNPECYTADMAGWWITVAIQDSTIRNCKSFDAVFNPPLKPINTIEGNLKTYYEMSDGTWQYNGRTYKYRLELSDRMPNAAVDSTFVYLSNLENITFEQAWKAAGFSSLSTDYFAVEDAVLVEMK